MESHGIHARTEVGEDIICPCFQVCSTVPLSLRGMDDMGECRKKASCPTVVLYTGSETSGTSVAPQQCQEQCKTTMVRMGWRATLWNLGATLLCSTLALEPRTCHMSLSKSRTASSVSASVRLTKNDYVGSGSIRKTRSVEKYI